MLRFETLRQDFEFNHSVALTQFHNIDLSRKIFMKLFKKFLKCFIS